MKEYHKIQTVYKRDPQNKNKTLIEGDYSLPEFEYLKDNIWVFTEKVDGTNICVMWNHKDNCLTFGGKTDNSSIPSILINTLNEMFCSSLMTNIFPDCDVCLYGEGYGPKIQKGGGNYRKDQSFVLFDVKIEEWWLKRQDVIDIGEKLNIDAVPIIGEGTLDDMVEMTRSGFNSIWGDFIAEGIVARPKVELKTRNGERLITKIKYKDFLR
jgi:hypothetical protein